MILRLWAYSFWRGASAGFFGDELGAFFGLYRRRVVRLSLSDELSELSLSDELSELSLSDDELSELLVSSELLASSEESES